MCVQQVLPFLVLALRDDKALSQGNGQQFPTRWRRIPSRPGDYPMHMDVSIQRLSIYLVQSQSTLRVLILHPRADQRKRASHSMMILTTGSEPGSTGRYKRYVCSPEPRLKLLQMQRIVNVRDHPIKRMVLTIIKLYHVKKGIRFCYWLFIATVLRLQHTVC